MNLYKERFKTPKECLDAYVESHPEYAASKATYAGRLDPLAEGVLPILFGEAVHNKDAVTALPKEYRVQILFGFATDTADVLGVLEKALQVRAPSLVTLLAALESLVGTREQKYPLFSSKTVEGKQLHEYGRSGTPVEIPTHMITINSIILTALSSIEVSAIQALVDTSCASVTGEFRQQKIKAIWDDTLRKFPGALFPLTEITVTCGSGAYMRVLAQELGEALSVPALAFSIVRTRVGDLTLENAIRPHLD